MPYLKDSSYTAPFVYRNPHFQTVYCSLFRRVAGVTFTRNRIFTPDGDFLDLDWSSVGADRLAILSHGLEGNSYSTYIKGMCKALNAAGWDVLAWNYRGCSGEPNRMIRTYHSGSTYDLETVLKHPRESGRFSSLALIGFSIGGNLVLKFAGESGVSIGSDISAIIAFSVPCDLADSAAMLAKPSSRLYMDDFLRFLRRKLEEKKKIFPEIDLSDFKRIRNFKDYDDKYTAPLNGFASAEDYWTRCSCKQFLAAISVPTLIVNSIDDPFLGKACFPIDESRSHPYVTLETPRRGGHVGFMDFHPDKYYWSEQRARRFLEELRSSVACAASLVHAAQK